MRVVAIARGHDGRAVREVGEEFDVADARLKDGSTWFVPTGSPAVAEAQKAEAAKEVGIPPGAGPTRGSKDEDPIPPGAGPRPKAEKVKAKANIKAEDIA